MARLSLTVHTASANAPADLGDAEVIIMADGAEFPNNGVERLVVHNGAVATREVTIPTPFTIDSLTLASRVYTLLAGETLICGPFSRNVYNQTNNTVYVDVDGADVEALVIR